MAIKSFKEIINNKGYRISSKDREVFEQGTLQSFFGFSDSDFIEFIVYDANDNQLPLQINKQGDTELVRYVQINSENIKDYFLISEGTLIQSGQLPNEYFIDVERLLRESGYNTGIFKTQITLLSKRVGDFNKEKKAKLWISEISPSRTEIKLLPQRNEVADKTDLLKRFATFKSNDISFRDDTIPYVIPYVNSIKPNNIDTIITSVYSDKFFKKLKSEFSISDFDSLMTQIYNKFIEVVNYEFSNKISDLNNINYGNPKSTKPDISLSFQTIKKIIDRKLIEVIDYYLPKRKITQTNVDSILDESFDKVGTILQRKESDVVIKAKNPQVQVVVEAQDSVEEVELDFEIKKIVDKKLPVLTPNPVKTENVVRTGGGSGGGGARNTNVQFDEITNQDDINPFTNRGDFVNRTVDNRNFR